MKTSDFADLLQAFAAHEVRFLVVGAYALAYHGRPRTTGDLDVWVEPEPDNAKRVMAALRDFGAPMRDLSEEDFARPGVVYQMGLVPYRIDVLTRITGVTFPEAWQTRKEGVLGQCKVFYLGKEAFIRNKLATGRHKDLADVEDLAD
jgi:hypothetical protein